MESTVKNKFNEKDFVLNENMWKVMLKLSWPAVIAMILYSLNSVFDAIFVGRYVGETALAGVSVAAPLTNISLALGSLLGVGAGSALSIAIGANDVEKQKKILPTMNRLIIISSLIFMIIGLIFGDFLIKSMGGKGEALEIGSVYFKTTTVCAVLWIYGLASNMVIRAEGKMKKAAFIMGIGLIVNIFFNYIFVVKLSMGVMGAALATNIGMLMYTVFGLIYFRKGKVSFKAEPFKVQKHKEISKLIFSMGSASFIMSIMTLIQSFVVFNALSKYGSTSEIAFYGVCNRILTFTLMPIMGLTRAFQPVVGINFGAGNKERVINAFKIFSYTSVILVAPLWIISMVKPELMLSVMLSDYNFTSSNLMNYRVLMSIMPVVPVVFISLTFLSATNNGKHASRIGLLRQLVLYVPVMMILPRLYGTKMIYIGSFAIDAVMSLVLFIVISKVFKEIKSGKRKEESM